MGMESLPRTIDEYKAPTYPTIIQSADLFRLQASFSRLFRRRSSLRRAEEVMIQQTCDSECHCCLIVQYLSQLHKQFVSPIPIVQLNWYCERGGD